MCVTEGGGIAENDTITDVWPTHQTIEPRGFTACGFPFAARALSLRSISVRLLLPLCRMLAGPAVGSRLNAAFALAKLLSRRAVRMQGSLAAQMSVCH
jgi:hypothetical protein